MSKSAVQFFSKLAFWHINHKIEDLAGSIARQCRMALSRPLSNISGNMPVDQMRGYIRAYATSCVELAVKHHADTADLSASHVSKVTLQAKELLIEMMVRDMQAVQTTCTRRLAAAA